MGLTASQNPYFAMGGNPPLTVTWKSGDDPAEIWERFSKGSNVFEKRDLTDSEHRHRKIVVPINKGEVYTAALYAADSPHPNPNHNLVDPPPRDLLTVAGIVDQHRDLISMRGDIGKGGTYLDAGVSTSESAFVLMQAGTTAPVVIPTPTASGVELQRIDAPDAEARSLDGTFHDLECKPLIPGELYSVVIMAIAQDGFWDCIVDSVNTKLRQVDITIKNIHIVNDGDPGSDGEAQFWVTVLEAGTAVQGTVVRTFNLGDDDFTVRDGENIPAPASWKVTIGPKKIDPKVDGIVAVHTNALEYDGIEGTEKAGSDGTERPLPFPAGRNAEVTGDTDVIVRGNPLDGDDFEYRISFDWNVTYV